MILAGLRQLSSTSDRSKSIVLKWLAKRLPVVLTGERRNQSAFAITQNQEPSWQRKSSALSSCKFRRERRIRRPLIGPALGQRGLNIMEFCKAFNAQTQGMEPGMPIPVTITAFADKSFTFIIAGYAPCDPSDQKESKVQRVRRPHTDKGRQADARPG